jgi:hypothetical protein
VYSKLWNTSRAVICMKCGLLSVSGADSVAWVLCGDVRRLRKVRPPHQDISGPLNAMGRLCAKGIIFPKEQQAIMNSLRILRCLV